MALTRYVFGVPRSGSTLAYNLVRLLTGQEVTHTHNFLNREDVEPPIVCTFRDFRDCAVSWWLEHDNAAGSDSVTFEQLQPRLDMLREFIPSLNRYKHEYPPDDVFFVRFRKWTSDLPAYAAELNRRLGLGLDDERVAEVAAKCSLANMRTHATQRHREWKLNPNHIYRAEPGTWRELVVAEDQERVTKFFEADLRAWGFDP